MYLMFFVESFIKLKKEKKDELRRAGDPPSTSDFSISTRSTSLSEGEDIF